MQSNYSWCSSEADEIFGKSTSKKRKTIGRVYDVLKSLRTSSHELGSDCMYKTLKCWKNISEEEHNLVIQHFNLLDHTNKQNSYLSGLITILVYYS